MNVVGRVLARGGLAMVRASQLHRLLTPLTGGLGVVLAFNRVRPRTGDAFQPNGWMEVTVDFLAKAVARLRRAGFDIVDLDEAWRRIEQPDRHRRFAVLTLDGGYIDTFEHAYPALKAVDCPFAVFVATGLVDRDVAPWWLVLAEIIAKQETIAVSLDGPVSYFDCRGNAAKRAAFRELSAWLSELGEDRQREALQELAWRYGVDSRAVVDAEMMTWEQVRTLAADPLVTIGAHTISFPNLAGLEEDRVRAEIRNGARVLEAATGKMPRHFAYPFGSAKAAGPREYRIVGELGFRTGLTSIPGVMRVRSAKNPAGWPRIRMDGRFQSLAYLDLVTSGLPYILRRRPRAAEPASFTEPVRTAASN